MTSASKRIDFVANTAAAWGDALPDWVAELAREATRTTATRTARRIGYSPAVLSAVFAAKYQGNMKTVEARVRGALMGLTVDCPVVGEIGRDRCLDQQRMGNTGASSIRARLYRACRGDCQHSNLKEADDAQP
ncbi:transcriptional regulator [Rhodopseudomonas palustris]|uniref:Transcriptional regulator n=1 Tax=Rhodopseudomonas palustris TaxID=1076 RepID=A0A418V464_RHOPL|nr:transcriptional regulator [Rhodopseudomonas palustris]RJF70900.1 transcriptional regulator [Rhodopseudomonas palustris]